jgi:hypothetical protein
MVRVDRERRLVLMVLRCRARRTADADVARNGRAAANSTHATTTVTKALKWCIGTSPNSAGEHARPRLIPSTAGASSLRRRRRSSRSGAHKPAVAGSILRAAADGPKGAFGFLEELLDAGVEVEIDSCDPASWYAYCAW